MIPTYAQDLEIRRQLRSAERRLQRKLTAEEILEIRDRVLAAKR